MLPYSLPPTVALQFGRLVVLHLQSFQADHPFWALASRDDNHAGLGLLVRGNYNYTSMGVTAAGSTYIERYLGRQMFRHAISYPGRQVHWVDPHIQKTGEPCWRHPRLACIKHRKIVMLVRGPLTKGTKSLTNLVIRLVTTRQWGDKPPTGVPSLAEWLRVYLVINAENLRARV